MLEDAFKALWTNNIATVKCSLQSLNNTYTRPAIELPRLLIWHPQLLLTRFYKSRNDAKKELQSVEKALISLGFIVSGCDSTSSEFKLSKWGMVFDSLVEAFVHARNAFKAMGMISSSKR